MRKGIDGTHKTFERVSTRAEDPARLRGAEFEQMRLDHQEYEAEMGVMPVPEDHDVMKQALRASDPGVRR